MAEHPLKPIEDLDPQLFNLVQQTRQLVFTDGALPKKIKFLIAMAFDAAHGKVEGTKSLATSAMQAGATKQEIAEVLRVAQYSAGAGAIYTAARAMKEMQ